jgi:hypothetical protein
MAAIGGKAAYHDEFQRGLRELGYVDRRNIVIEYRLPPASDRHGNLHLRVAAGGADPNLKLICPNTVPASGGAVSKARYLR